MDAKTDIEVLREKVAKNTDVIKSAVDLIKGFKAKLEECLAHEDDDDGDISMDIKALADELGSQTDALAAAVAENTDSGPVPDDGEGDDHSGNGGNGGDPGGETPAEPSDPSVFEDPEGEVLK